MLQKKNVVVQKSTPPNKTIWITQSESRIRIVQRFLTIEMKSVDIAKI